MAPSVITDKAIPHFKEWKQLASETCGGFMPAF